MAIVLIRIGLTWKKYQLIIRFYRHLVISLTLPSYATTNRSTNRFELGQWFAHVAPSDQEVQEDPNDTDDDHARSIPDAKLLNELYAAAGHARQHMPNLKFLDLTLKLHCGWHALSYGFDKSQKRHTLILESDVDFAFSSEVARAWRFDKESVCLSMGGYGNTFITEVLL